MITINKMTSEIVRTLSGGDQARESKIQRREVHLRVRQVLSELLKVEMLNNRSFGDRAIPTLCIATYEGIDIVPRAEGDDTYKSAIPEFYMSLPYNKGIHALYPDNLPEQQFVRRNNSYVSQGMQSSKLNGRGYWVDGFVIHYDATDINKTMKMTLKLVVPAPDKIGIDDPLPIYPEHQTEAMRRVIQDMSMQLAVPEDQINEGVSPNVNANG